MAKTGDVASPASERSVLNGAVASRVGDPYGDPPAPLRVVGHGPAHPAGRASRDLGRQIREWREALGLSQQDLAHRLGWEQPHVARLEAGVHTPNLATLDRLACRLGVQIILKVGPQGMTVHLERPPT